MTKMTVVKTDVDPYVIAWFWAAYPVCSVVPQGSHTLSYDWIDGRPPATYEEYKDKLREIWNVPDDNPALKRYAGLLQPRLMDFDLYAARCAHHPMGIAACKALAAMPSSTFTPVNMIHGDPTFSNIIIKYTTGKAELIDPGHHRGLCCKELDEAKVLQSYDGFERVCRRIQRPDDLDIPDCISQPVHWVMLITHYVRLLRHIKCERSLAFARMRITALARSYL